MTFRTRQRLRLGGAMLLGLISIGLLAYVEISRWNECRAAFSWWYCLRMISA